MSEVDPKRPFILTIPNVLTSKECKALRAKIDESQPKVAPISTVAGPVLKTDVRNNERVMFEDHSLAATLLQRVAHKAPPDIHGMRLVGANELLRCYRYKPGMRFAPHSDGAFVRNESEQSWYTLIVYLNDDFEGGHTTFLVEPEVSIKPETGMALLFQHPIVHEGSVVTSGIKYVVRSDLMYRKN
jgi:predicted 2-oxoglutarate/Fe(II)-dependent dioxygenase YbiX